MRMFIIVIMLCFSLTASQLFGQTANEILMLRQHNLELLEYSTYFTEKTADFTANNMIDEAYAMQALILSCADYVHSCEIISTLGQIKLHSNEAHIKESCEDKISWKVKTMFSDELFKAKMAQMDALLTAAESKSLSLDSEIIEKVKDFQDEIEDLRMLFHLIIM